MNGMTAAHPTLPFGSLVRVVNLQTGKSRIVRINDRGPFVEGREIDLSRESANLLGMGRGGLAQVELQLLEVPQRR
jgi:rare lipoprotein A